MDSLRRSWGRERKQPPQRPTLRLVPWPEPQLSAHLNQFCSVVHIGPYVPPRPLLNIKAALYSSSQSSSAFILFKKHWVISILGTFTVNQALPVWCLSVESTSDSHNQQLVSHPTDRVKAEDSSEEAPGFSLWPEAHLPLPVHTTVWTSLGDFSEKGFCWETTAWGRPLQQGLSHLASRV